MVVIDFMVERLWKVAKHIVLTWSDQASEIFIIDLPLEDLPRILSVVRHKTVAPVVLRYDGLDLSQEMRLSQAVCGSIVSSSEKSTVHSLRGQVSAGADCYFYFWIDADSQKLETEMVFWNDTSFPPGRSVSEHKRMLGQLLRIAHDIRGDNHHSKCILSPEYNSEPKELLNADRRKVAIW